MFQTLHLELDLRLCWLAAAGGTWVYQFRHVCLHICLQTHLIGYGPESHNNLSVHSCRFLRCQPSP